MGARRTRPEGLERRRGRYTSSVRLSSFSFENYRSFADLTSVEIRPLTLFFGYNSAGKSSALRLLPVVGASVTAPGRTPLALDSEPARGASFRDVLSRLTAAPTLELGFAWSDSAAEVNLRLAIRDLPDRQTQILDRVRVEATVGGAVQVAEALWDTENSRPGSSAQRYEFKVGDTAPESGEASVSGLRFTVLGERPFSSAFALAASELLGLGERTYWLNSLRAVPDRTARFGPAPLRLAPDGKNAGEFLAHDDLAGGERVSRVSMWFRQITGHLLSIKRFAVGSEQHYSVVTTPPKAAAVEIPIVDTGEGMAQVLPVIVLACLAELGDLGDNPLLAIEHPELHLHPAAHAELAAMFCSLALADSRPTLLLETHSENFLLRVQLAIARGEIPHGDVVVHWVRSLDDGRSVVDTIRFDEAAQPSTWPPGVFGEDSEQAKSLLRVRRERGLS
jgi:hypothetical protein